MARIEEEKRQREVEEERQVAIALAEYQRKAEQVERRERQKRWSSRSGRTRW